MRGHTGMWTHVTMAPHAPPADNDVPGRLRAKVGRVVTFHKLGDSICSETYGSWMTFPHKCKITTLGS